MRVARYALCIGGPWNGLVREWTYLSSKLNIVGQGTYVLDASNYRAVWYPEEDSVQGLDDKQATVGEGGGVRSEEGDKTDYTLILDGPMYDRWAAWMTLGAKKYAARNWMKFEDQAALDRARRSLSRHYRAYMAGQEDEDHAAAIYANVNFIEYIKDRLPVTEARTIEDYSDALDQPFKDKGITEGETLAGG